MKKTMVQLTVVGLILTGCQSIPIVDKMAWPSARVERFYAELDRAKDYRTRHPIEAPQLKKTSKQEWERQ